MSRIDKKDLKERVVLARIIEADLGPPVEKSGGWLKWFCPFHDDRAGGSPSLTVKGEKDKAFHCFGCGETGDVFNWCNEIRNLPFAQALQVLAKMVNLPAGATKRARPSPTARPVESRVPGDKWQATARRYVAKCRERLWSEGQPGLDYLRAGGLGDETIRAAGLGWKSKDSWHDPKLFGLTPWKNARGRPGKVWLPAGVVIPCEADGVLWYVKTRRFKDGLPATDGQKYPQVRGSESALYGADGLAGGRPLLLTEGERDCLLALQELSGRVDVATLGGASKSIPGRWLARFLPYADILACYDADQAGQRGAENLAALSHRFKVLTIPLGDDLTEFCQRGGNLSVWLAYHLARLKIEPLPGDPGPTGGDACPLPGGVTTVGQEALATVDLVDLHDWLKDNGLAVVDSSWPVGVETPTVTVA